MFEIFYMDGYGAYVWTSFIFTLFCFSLIYVIIKKQLIKEKNKFLVKFSSLSSSKTVVAIQQNTNKQILAYSKINKI